jgi:hypothetical protein
MSNLKKILFILALGIAPLAKDIGNEIVSLGNEIVKIGKETGRTEYSEKIQYDIATVVGHNYFAKPKSGLVMQTDYGYETIFQGETTRFKVKDKATFDKFSLRQKAKVKYLEKYASTYKDLNRDGEDEFMETKAVSSKFLDAKLIN